MDLGEEDEDEDVDEYEGEDKLNNPRITQYTHGQEYKTIEKNNKEVRCSRRRVN